MVIAKDVVDLKNEYFKKNMSIFSIVSFDEARKYFHADSYKTWSLLVLSIWCEKHLGGVQ